MSSAFLSSLVSLLTAAQLFAGEPTHALRQGGRDVVFRYGVVPAQVVLAHPDKHPQREMHGGAAPRGASHEPMAIANQASFGGFFPLPAPGIYRLRFEARRPGIAGISSAEFEYRVAREGRR